MSSAQVLVVEDENIVSKAIQNELRQLGYHVPEIAVSGEEAIRKAEETRPDLILMDIYLKGPMDGIEAARQVQNRFDIPVVYLTAFGDPEILERAKCTGPFGYLLKPYEEKELRTTIEVALHKHRLEHQLRETKQWLSAILQSVDNAVIATDSRHHIRFMNAAAEQLVGRKQPEVFGNDLFEICRLRDSTGANPLQDTAQTALQGGASTELSAECRLATHGSDVWVEGSVAPNYDDCGNFTGLVVTLRDVSARRHLDELRRQSEDYLRHAEKMEAVSKLAGGFAHHFNNLLTVIVGNTSLALLDQDEINPNRSLIQQVAFAAGKASELVQQLQKFSGGQPFHAALVDINEVVDELLGVLQRDMGQSIHIEVACQKQLWLVQADRTQIKEALLNLCLNAQEAMPDGGRLVIESANVVIDEAHLRRVWVAQPGEHVRLRVQDAGHGIPAEIQPHIFEPFFTSKSLAKGVGLGLALVHGIVEDHNGWVEYVSRPEEGTTFDIYLPRYGGATTKQMVAAPRSAKPGRTILLADDEPMIRQLGKTILEECGYEVVLAEDGMEAVEIFQNSMVGFDLVILDQSMPRLSGQDTFQALLQIDPNVAVLFSSGNFGNDQAQIDPRMVGIINKPYTYETLINVVQSALENRS